MINIEKALNMFQDKKFNICIYAKKLLHSENMFMNERFLPLLFMLSNTILISIYLTDANKNM